MRKIKPELLAVYAIYLILQGLTFLTGLTIEEVRDLWIFKQMDGGLIPFRDFIFEYGPLGPWLWHWIIQITGSELFVLRIVCILLGLPCIWVGYKIALRFVPARPAAFIGLASYGVLTFPTYAYTHVFSVITLMAMIYAAFLYLERRRLSLFLWTVFFSVLTLLIRPLPTGVTAVIAFSIALLMTRWKANSVGTRIKNTLIYFIGTFGATFFCLFAYAKILRFPMLRWTAMNFSIFFGKPFSQGGFFKMELPNPFPQIFGYLHEIKEPTENLKIIFLKGFILSNSLTGYWADCMAFLLPLAYLGYLGYRHFKKCDDPAAKVFLAFLAVGLGIYYHYTCVGIPYMPHLNVGFAWTTVGFFLLPPGLILGLILLYEIVKQRRWKEKKSASLIAIMAMWLIFAPHIVGFRYLFVPMKRASFAGIHHILLGQNYADELVPTVEILKNDNASLPKTIYSPYSEFEFFAPQKPAFPEYYYMGYLPDSIVLKPDLFPGLPKPMTVGELIADRVKKLKPVIVIRDQNFHLFKEKSQLELILLRDYTVYRRVFSRNTVNPDLSSSVVIYVPKK